MAYAREPKELELKEFRIEFDCIRIEFEEKDMKVVYCKAGEEQLTVSAGSSVSFAAGTCLTLDGLVGYVPGKLAP